MTFQTVGIKFKDFGLHSEVETKTWSITAPDDLHNVSCCDEDSKDPERPLIATTSRSNVSLAGKDNWTRNEAEGCFGNLFFLEAPLHLHCKLLVSCLCQRFACMP
jgi:hypothetical protein